MKNKLLFLGALAFASVAYADSGVVTTTPEGTLYSTVYGKSEKSFLLSSGGFGSFSGNYGYCTQLVVDGNDFYLHNIVREYPGMDSWVKGTLNAEGNVEFSFPQAVAVDNNGQTLYASMIVANSSGGGIDLVPDTQNPKLVLKWDEVDLTLTQVLPGSSTGDLAKYDGMIGLVTEDGTFRSYGETGVSYAVWEDEAQTPPQTLTVADYNAVYSNEWNEEKKQLVKIGFDGDTFWIRGLCSAMPSAWIKGTVGADGSVTLPSRQYLGISNDYFYFFFGADNTGVQAGTEYSWLEAATLVPSEEDSQSAYTASTSMMMNLGETRPWFGEGISGLTLTEKVMGDPIPVNPVFGEPEWDENDGMGVADFYIAPEDVNGQALETENLYYRVYYNGELVTDLYEAEGVPAGDIPFGKESDLILYEYDWHFVIFLEKLDSIGVQSVYKADDKDYCSDIVTYSFSSEGVEGIKTADVVRTEYYTVTGIKTAEPCGVAIRCDILSDGSVKRTKVFVK